MAFSTFVFDTLDVCTRLGRYIVQELFGWRSRAGALAGTLLTVALPAYFIAFAPPNSWSKFWTLFGASNQLLAALTLLTITAWLYQARKRIAYTLVPMLVRAGHHALGALGDGRREPARDEGVRRRAYQRGSRRPRSSCSRSTSR